MTRGRSRADLDSDRQLNLAVVRLLEIVGEAANRLPRDFHSRHAQIPWADIVAFRNRVVHGYDTVDYDVVWHVITTELPPLIMELERLLTSEDTAP